MEDHVIESAPSAEIEGGTNTAITATSIAIDETPRSVIVEEENTSSVTVEANTTQSAAAVVETPGALTSEEGPPSGGIIAHSSNAGGGNSNSSSSGGGGGAEDLGGAVEKLSVVIRNLSRTMPRVVVERLFSSFGEVRDVVRQSLPFVS